MKRIVVLRHARSIAKPIGIPDTYRVLETEGIVEVSKVCSKACSKFKEYKIGIDKVFTSDAVRAISTAAIFSREIGIPTDRIHIKSWLYETDVERILEFLTEMDDSFNTLAIVGHNPTLGELVNSFSEDEIHGFPPGSLAVIEFGINSWQKLKALSQEVGKKVGVHLLITP